MLPDLLPDLRSLNSLFQSAESYLQEWERCEQQAAQGPLVVTVVLARGAGAQPADAPSGARGAAGAG